MKFEITEKELNELFKDKILAYLKESFGETNMEYWVRNEVHKILSKEVVEEHIKKNYSNDDLKKILKEAFENHVREKFE